MGRSDKLIGGYSLESKENLLDMSAGLGGTADGSVPQVGGSDGTVSSGSEIS